MAHLLAEREDMELWGAEPDEEWKMEWDASVQQTIRAGSQYRLPPPHNQITMGQQTLSITGFSDSPTSGGVDVGQFTEDEIAEAIFDWWISGKPYKQWYAEKYLQQKINFEYNENN